MYDHCWKGEEEATRETSNIQSIIYEGYQVDAEENKCQICGGYFEVHQRGCENDIDEFVREEDLEF